MGMQESGAASAKAVVDAVLGDPNGQSVASHCLEQLGEALRVLLPADVGETAAETVAVVKLEEGSARNEAKPSAGVIIQSDKVEAVASAGDVAPGVEESRHPHPKRPRAERFQKGVVVGDVGEPD